MSRLLKIYLGLIATLVVFSVFDWPWTQPIRNVAKVGILFLTFYYAFKLTRHLIKKFLWRIRRKLILSYIFIGFVPVSLLFVLFFLGFFIFMGQATSETFNSILDGYVLQTKIESEKLLHLTEFMDSESAIKRWLHELRPEDMTWLGQAEITLISPEGEDLLQGKQKQLLPQWVKEQEFAGLVLRDGLPWLAAVHQDTEKQRSLQIHVPVSAALLDLIKKRADAEIHYLPFSAGQSAQNEFQETLATTKKQPLWPVWWDFPIWWLSLPDQFDWSTGKKIRVFEIEEKEHKQPSKSLVMIGEKGDVKERDDSRIGAFWVRTNVSRVYNRIFSRSTSLQKFVYALMVAVAMFFLFIELISLISGFLLARSITASIHNLFEGTERIKAGDLNYKIKVRAKDQLGELAASFNNMTDSIQNLLVEQSEKERLAESLRIARQMQENLLPREITSAGNIEIAALNLPAQEVCGDYYDIIRKEDGEMGIIIADVSGKGPSAALYMAEVKGVILSLSQQTMVPRDVLLRVNSILGPTLDSRNFITMTYAMIDKTGSSMRISRAGHNPILHYRSTAGRIDVVQPGGIGLGLGRNGLFEKALEEVGCPLNAGDILVFYTDGLTEAMNEKNQLYGLPRLSEIILRNKDQSTAQIKSAILHDLELFLNQNLPQDDITLVLLKVR